MDETMKHIIQNIKENGNILNLYELLSSKFQQQFNIKSIDNYHLYPNEDNNNSERLIVIIYNIDSKTKILLLGCKLTDDNKVYELKIYYELDFNSKESGKLFDELAKLEKREDTQRLDEDEYKIYNQFKKNKTQDLNSKTVLDQKVELFEKDKPTVYTDTAIDFLNSLFKGLTTRVSRVSRVSPGAEVYGGKKTKKQKKIKKKNKKQKRKTKKNHS